MDDSEEPPHASGPFVKLYGSILRSSIWLENAETRLVWITLLAMADQVGFVEASMGGLAHTANVSVDACSEAIRVFTSPDPDSKDPDNDGRRVAVVPRGFQVLNYLKYREYRSIKQVQDARRQQLKRERDASRMSREVTRGHVKSRRVATEVDAEAEVEQTTPLTPQGGNGSDQVRTLHRRKRRRAEGVETLDVLGNRQWIDAYNEILNAKLEYGNGNLTAVQRARDHGYTIEQARQTFQALAEQSTPLAKWCVEHRKWDLEFLIRPPHSRQGNWTLGMIDKIHNELASGMVNE